MFSRTVLKTRLLLADVRQRLGKRPHSPEPRKVLSKSPEPRREPVSDVHSRLGVPKPMEGKGLYSDSKEKKTGEPHGPVHL